jgi:hypothetical protein
MNPALRELVELLARAAYQELQKAPPPTADAQKLMEHRSAA